MKKTKVYVDGTIEIDGTETGSIDWIELHKALVVYSANERIYIFKDGTIENLGNSYLQNEDDVLAIMRTWGRGNMDTTSYSDDWTDYNKDDDTYTTDDGRVLSEDEMIEECIEEGDWTEQIELWLEEINNQIEESEIE